MSEAVAKEGDRVVGVDTHIVLIPAPGGAIPTPMTSPFSGPLEEALSESVFVENASAALVGSVASNVPRHIPLGGSFQTPPSNRATVSSGSESVFVETKAVARATDPASCCNDPKDADTGHVLANGTVFAG